MVKERVELIITANAQLGNVRNQLNSVVRDIQRAQARANKSLSNMLALNFGDNAVAMRNLKNPLDDLTRSIHRGKISADQFRLGMRNLNNIIVEQGKLAGSHLIPELNALNRSFSSGTMIMSDFGAENIRLRHKLAATNTMFRAWTTNVIDLGKNMQWAGRQIMVGFGVPFGIAMIGASSAFRGFEAELIRFRKVFNSEMHGISAEAAGDQMVNLADRLVTELGRARKETLSVAGTFAQMGFDNDTVESITEQTMRLATLGETSVEDATKLLRAYRATWGLTNEELGQTVNLLNAIENSTAISISDMVISMPQIIPLFEQWNLTLGEGEAIIAGMFERLGSAPEAVNAFKVIVPRIFDPTQKGFEQFNDHFKQFGINLGDLSERYEDDLIGMLGALGDALREADLNLDEFSDTFGEVLGGRQAGRAITSMVAVSDALRGKDNSFARAMEQVKEFNTETGRMEQSADAAKELSAQVDSLSGQFNVLKQSIVANFEEIGKFLQPILNDAMRLFNGMLEAFNALTDKQKRWIFIGALIGALTGAVTMFLGIFLNLAGTLMRAFSGLLPTMQFLTKEEKAQQQMLLLMSSATTQAAINNELLAKSMGIAAGQAGILETALDRVNRELREQIIAEAKANGMRISGASAKSHADRRMRELGLVAMTGDRGGVGPGPTINRSRISRGLRGGAKYAGVAGGVAMTAGMLSGDSGVGSTAMTIGMIASLMPMTVDAVFSAAPLIKKGLKSIASGFVTLGAKIAAVFIANDFIGAVKRFAKLLGPGGIFVGAVAAATAAFVFFNKRAGEAAEERLPVLQREFDSLAESMGLADDIAKDSVLFNKTVAQDNEKDLGDFVARLKAMNTEAERARGIKNLVYDLTLRGATPEQIQEVLDELAKKHDFKIPVELDIQSLRKSAIEAITLIGDEIIAPGIAREIGMGFVKLFGGDTNRLFGDNKAATGQAAEMLSNALKAGDIETFTKGLVGFQEAMLSTPGMTRDLASDIENYLIDEILRLADISGIAAGDVDSIGQALILMGNGATDVAVKLEPLLHAIGQITSLQAAIASGGRMVNGRFVAWSREDLGRMTQALLVAESTRDELLESALATEDIADESEDVADGLGSAAEEAEGLADALKSAGSNIRKYFEDSFKERIDSALEMIEERFEAELEGLESIQEAEEKLDDKREKQFLDELKRRRALSDQYEEMANLQLAIASGDLERAAQIEAKMRADNLKQEEDKIRELFKTRSDARKEYHDEERERLEEEQQQKMDAIEEELEELMKTVPKTAEEWEERNNRILEIFRENGVSISDGMVALFSNATQQMEDALTQWKRAAIEDYEWEQIGNTIGEQLANGVYTSFSEGLDAIVAMLISGLDGSVGTEPARTRDPVQEYADLTPQERAALRDSTDTHNHAVTSHSDLSIYDVEALKLHSGGKVGGVGDVPAILQSGEFVMQRSAVNRLGVGYLEHLNNGNPHEAGGPFRVSGSPLGKGSSATSGGLNPLTAIASTSLFPAALIQILTELLGSVTGGGAGGTYSGQHHEALQPPDFDRTNGAYRYYGGWTHNLASYVPPIISSVLASVPGAQGISSAYRSPSHNKAVGGSPTSAHVKGKGVDIIASNNSKSNLNKIGRAFEAASSKYPKIKRSQIFYPARDIPGGHQDHAHIGFYHQGGLVQLMKGGKIMQDNTLANLHKGEMVLRRPVAKALEQGIRHGGMGGSSYNVSINVGSVSNDVDINRLAQKVGTELAKADRRKGMGRGIR